MGAASRSNSGNCGESQPCPAPRPHWQRMNVLVVDDHSTYRALIGWFLQKLGVNYLCRGDGFSGLKAVIGIPVDLIICDCRMPRMDGYDMARAIREHERRMRLKRVPIVALTANLQNDSPRRCREAGMDDWLLKPLTLTQLHRLLERWSPGPHAPLDGEPAAAPAPTWPTREGLIATFGCTVFVDQMLERLLAEAWEDYALLSRACSMQNAALATERLHRLVGSLVFLGGTDLETRGLSLIEQLMGRGMDESKPQVEAFQGDLRAYLDYLAAL
ncbi:response regulator [Pseudomonas fluorescens ABAC62]|nr:response regulator [Pseudomonas fluorescens ABAC62]